MSILDAQWVVVWFTVATILVTWVLLTVPLSQLITPQDVGYCLGRPHTMEGGAYHWPLYVPYVLYPPKSKQAEA